MDPETHQRYLSYRDKHGYFGGTSKLLGRDEFIEADKEHRELDAKGDRRDDDEETRYEELAKLLYRD